LHVGDNHDAGEDAVRILALQLPGTKPFAAAEFRRGHRVQAGDRMGVAMLAIENSPE
jgi:hypothetical protein